MLDWLKRRICEQPILPEEDPLGIFKAAEPVKESLFIEDRELDEGIIQSVEIAYSKANGRKFIKAKVQTAETELVDIFLNRFDYTNFVIRNKFPQTIDMEDVNVAMMLGHRVKLRHDHLATLSSQTFISARLIGFLS